MAHRKKKAIAYEFDQDGSGHGRVTYFDGTSKRFSKDITDTSIGYISQAYGKRAESVREAAGQAVSEAKKAIVSLPGGFSSLFQSAKILFTNEQAGIEKAGKELGVKEINALTQQMRAARNRAGTALGDVQYIAANGEWRRVGKGLAKIFEPIKAKGHAYWNNFQMYLFHQHNVDRMSLYERSLAKNEANIAEFDALYDKLSVAKRELEDVKKKLSTLSGVNNPYIIERYSSKVADTAGVKRIRIHDFRHSYASFVLSSGVSIVALSASLGHASSKETLDTYSHMLPNDYDLLTKALESHSQYLA